jgi:internalin A
MKPSLKHSLLALLLAAGVAHLAPAAADEPKHPQPLPADVVQVWEKAGAEAGWIGTDECGQLEFGRAAEGKKGELPAFSFDELKDGVVPRLPQPPQAFGLKFADVRENGAGLKDLAGLKNLRYLNIAQTLATDAGLRELAGLSRIQKLDLCGTHVGDAGLAQLAGLENLESLNLEGTQLTDAGLQALDGLKNLRVLSLGDTQVADKGLKELAGLKNLKVLDLYLTRVTDAGLKELAGLKNLESLNVGATDVTDAGVKKLQPQLPKCKIANRIMGLYG